MKRLFSLTMVFYLLLSAFPQFPFLTVAIKTVQMQIDEIDAQIAELEEMKRGYEARALRHEDYAERLQFDNQAYLETRRHIQLADENRQKAEVIQVKIDQLKAKKEALLLPGKKS